MGCHAWGGKMNFLSGLTSPLSDEVLRNVLFVVFFSKIVRPKVHWIQRIDQQYIHFELGNVGIHRWRRSFWGFQQDCFWINTFLICHKGSYGLSSSPTVLQIFTPRCEDMPETQLWVTIGQWDRHPWPGNKTQLLPLFTLFSLLSRDLSWGPPHSLVSSDLSGGPLSLLSPPRLRDL